MTTLQRVARPPLIILVPMLLSALYGWVVFATTFRAPGVFGPNYDTPGTDYMVFHGGITVAMQRDWRVLFDPDLFTAYLNRAYSAQLSFPLTYRPWVYPPSFLVLLLPFAPFGFVASYLLFQAVTAGALVTALCAGRDRLFGAGVLAVAVLIAPAASVNVLWGQGAFFTAALLIGGVRLMPRRGVWAGVLFGLLSVKPQHALLIPFMLVAVRAWRTLIAAGVTALALALLSAAIFGVEAWRLWVHTAETFAGNVPLWDSSLHTCAVLLGAPAMLANVLIAAAIIGGGLLVYWAFRDGVHPARSLAILLAASNLAAPHTGPYDTMLLLLAVEVMLADPGRPQPILAWTLGLLVWLLPFFGQPLVSPMARAAPLVTFTLIAWVCLQSSTPKTTRLRQAVG